MNPILVAGIDTEVGKTLVSAILTILFNADYWKPIQSGPYNALDTTLMKTWLEGKHLIHPPSYSLKAPLSPHHAARLENIKIDKNQIILPNTGNNLIIEGVGGVFTPLTNNLTFLDLSTNWNCHWILVSKHYLGSINHTLLTINALKQRGISLLGIIFNGEFNIDSESAILEYSKVPCLGRLEIEPHLDYKTFTKYAEQWKSKFYQAL